MMTNSSVYAANSSLSKRGYDTTTNSSTTIKSGVNNRWVIGYNNLSGSPASVLINDPIPAGSIFQTGSVQTPPGWITQYSSDQGNSYGVTDTGSNTTHLQFNNPLVAETANGSSEVATQPLATSSQSGTGEDAYMPIPYNGKVYGIIHHSTQAGNELVCSNTDGTICAGYPKALDLSGQTDFYTSLNSLSYLDKANGNLYFTAQRNNGFGMICWNLNSNNWCSTGYTSLSASGAVLGADQPSRILGPAKVGNCLYGWDTNFVVYSYDITTMSAGCGTASTYPVGTTYSLPNYIPSEHNLLTSNYGPVSSLEVIDGKIYFVANYTFRADINLFCGITNTNYCETQKLICFDPTNVSGACMGWTTPNIGAAAQPIQYISTIFQDKGNSNNPCVALSEPNPGSMTTVVTCYDKTSGTSASVPANLVSNVFDDARVVINDGGNALVSAFEEVVSTNSSGDIITVFPFTKGSIFGNNRTGGAGCYNWTTGDECVSWGSNSDGETHWDTVNSGNTRDYGYAEDESGCLLGIGDAGWIWSFSPDDGSTPCRRTVANVDLNPAAYYCDGDGNVTGWNEVKVSSINFADLNELRVSIFDNNGNPVGGYQDISLLPSGTLDISSIPYAGDTQHLTIKVLFVAQNTNPWANGNAPIVQATFSGDDAQFCFTTIAQDNCQIPSIINQANSTTTQLDDSTQDTKNASVSLALITSQNQQCGVTISNIDDNNSKGSSLLATTGGKAILGVLIIGMSLIVYTVYKYGVPNMRKKSISFR